MDCESNRAHVLGLDIGVGSIGWAIIDVDGNDEPCSVLAAGVRGFDTGIPNMRDYRKGAEKLSNAKRRTCRSQRRQTYRRANRRSRVFRILQTAGLLPRGKSDSRRDRHALLMNLDKDLALLAKTRFPNAGWVHDAHTLVYGLRAVALDHQLPPYAVGRAFYHLCQRRGFKSNRKVATAEDDADQRGKVETGISSLREEMRKVGAKTLGQYFITEPFLSGVERIRNRWTSREMYRQEFEEIWKSQQAYNASLTPALKQELQTAIFRQRPTWVRKGVVGKCSLERGHRRAPIACLDFQRFRYRQQLSNLNVVHPSREEPALTSLEYDTLAARLELDGDLGFPKIRELLGLRKPRGAKMGFKFNLELDEEDSLVGNRTAARLREVLGDDWLLMSSTDQHRLVDEIVSFENIEALGKRLVKVFPSLGEEKARRVAGVRLERGYCSLSRKALRKLLPLMEDRKSFAEARQEVYGKPDDTVRLCGELPPLREWQPDIRNPVVIRVLSELRTVVNHIVRRFGKPKFIRVELARDMRHSRKRREKIARVNLANRKARRTIISQILKELPNWQGSNCSRTDILKVQLAQECGWRCPYTGEQISMLTLLGPSPQFHIEHIFPRRYGDDSFVNKTLCHHSANARKADQTPYEAFSGDASLWREILDRVRRFNGRMKKAKLQRFLASHVPADFVDQQLNDTAYASRLARSYLALLLGSASHVQVSPGRATHHLAKAWQLHGLLQDSSIEDSVPNEREGKNRNDHRHHAIDAIVIGVTNGKMLSKLGNAAQRAEERGTRLSAEIEPPWPDYLRGIRSAIQRISVSWRQGHRIRGALHKETYYRQPTQGARLTESTRIPLKAITCEEQLDAIVDDRIRELVRAKFKQHTAETGESPFENENNHPHFKTKQGHIVFVHAVRVKPKKGVTVISIGRGVRRRWVHPGADNHHVEVIASVNASGDDEAWEYHLCDRLEAARRASAKQSVVRREHGEGKKFRFSLAKNEYVTMEYQGGERCLYRVTEISAKEIAFHLHTDARPTKMKGRKRVRCGEGGLFRAKARKVAVDPLGNILPAHD